MRRISVVAAFVAVIMMLASAPALAGEWNPGNFNAPGGDVPGKYKANSECVFNGLDEPDESSYQAGDGEPLFGPGFGDDAFWTNKPGRSVQTAGHANRLGLAEPGDPGTACNGHLNPLK